ncbi:MAG: hypothetical protein IPM38_11450 [Ignavibacteria bacterium]|nr:hypothetical protein [Ignavibacteria bacterium]
MNLLDAEGEFFYDIPNQTLYFYAPGGANPNTLQIQATVSRIQCIFKSRCKICDHRKSASLTCKKSGRSTNGTSITVRNCRISKSR